MGQSQSNVKQVAKTCRYNKQEFNNKIAIVQDAHNVLQFYAKQLLSEKMPIQLDYTNYNEISEDYFNTRRKDEIPEFTEANPKIKNYYDFYKAIESLDREYTRNDITENERRQKITDVFNLCQIVLTVLVNELGVSCEEQKYTPVK